MIMPKATPMSIFIQLNSEASKMRAKLADNIKPVAKALETPNHFGVIFLKNKNGNAPIPVANAVIKAAIKTVNTLTSNCTFI